jgi:catechol 2,3-dioxygenase-like lactoylglutathione lyase family enzyme
VTVQRLGFLGVRVADPDRYEATVALYRDILALPVIAEVAGQSTWFRLEDGTQVHVYGPRDDDHVAFGEAPCVGLVVADVDGSRARMEAAGIEFLWETQRDDRTTWAHYRGPDGAVYELISSRSEPDERAPAESG